MNTTEGATLIAIFMGATFDGKKYCTFPNGEIFVHGEGYDAQLQYHSSWDWLIPSVKKFIDIQDINESRDRNAHSGFCNRLHNTVTDYSIKPVFDILTEAIQWYNTNQLTTPQT